MVSLEHVIVVPLAVRLMARPSTAVKDSLKLVYEVHSVELVVMVPEVK